MNYCQASALWIGRSEHAPVASRRALQQRLSRLAQQHLALEAVRIAEEDAQRPAEVADCPVTRPGIDEPVPDRLECLLRRGRQPDVINAGPAPHRRLAISFGRSE